jgi:hypothetical protein
MLRHRRGLTRLLRGAGLDHLEDAAYITTTSVANDEAGV